MSVNTVDHTQTISTVVHGAGIVGTALATLAGWLPPIAALVSIIWGLLQIYSWFEKRRKSK